jgi:Fe2+ or Zn2+ uptake regulation protein
LHYHFTCQNCGQVQDLEVEPDSRWEAKIECLTGLAINHHRAEFYGLCSDCRN